MASVLGPRNLLSHGIRHKPDGLVPRINLRAIATAVPAKTYDVVIVGAGPGGLTAASNLLDEGLNVCMIDPSFTAGRISEKYREVPSNTKVKMFAQWATATEAFAKVIQAAPEKNPYSQMLTFDQEKGCMLGDAIGVAQMLSDGLRADERVDSIHGKVKKIRRHEGGWFLPEHDIKAKKVVLAQGSHPRPWPLVLRGREFRHIQKIDLETCLKPSELKTVVSAGSVVGVVGSSHSAVLAIKNLYEIPGVKIVNFYRSPLLYAEYKDDWILYDNTGLKGIAADWGKEVLEHPDIEKLTRVDMKAEGAYRGPGNRSERDFYQKALKRCSHLVAAVGYVENEWPAIRGISWPANARDTHAHFDPHTGKFTNAKIDGEPVPGLYGAGIAYPETVTDKAGNVESAVGWFKFMKFLKRVGPEWAKAD